MSSEEQVQASSQDDQARQDVLNAMLFSAAFDGWSMTALADAGRDAGLGDDPSGELERLFPRGIADVFDFWAQTEDDALEQAWRTEIEKPQRIREQVTWLVRRRIEGLAPHREAARRAGATLLLPVHAGLGARFAWRTAGRVWRILGDKSLDGNYYTKRATLSTVYLSTLARWFTDEPSQEDMAEGDADAFAETWAFLDQRIDNVMQFEKLKATWNKRVPSPDKVADWFGKLRYEGFGRG